MWKDTHFDSIIDVVEHSKHSFFLDNFNVSNRFTVVPESSHKYYGLDPSVYEVMPI